jgi:hypothetical protein
MVSDVEPMALPSRNVGGEFVGNVPITGLLSKLDAGAPYNGWFFGSGLRFYPEKKAEKTPMGSYPLILYELRYVHSPVVLGLTSPRALRS